MSTPQAATPETSIAPRPTLTAAVAQPLEAHHG